MQKFFLYAFIFLLGMGTGYFICNKTATQSEEAPTETTQDDTASQKQDLSIFERASTKKTKKDTGTHAQQSDVTMVSFSQDGSINSPTISLKNNTTHDIRSVHFRIIYYDMKNNPIDYQDCKSYEEIASGLTKKIQIKRFGEIWEYHYYKDKPERYYPKESIPFKIKYQLLDYETE